MPPDRAWTFRNGETLSELHCAFLTMDDTEGWAIDAHLAIPHLQDLGWSVEQIAWKREDVDWGRFDAVYIGTPWDYPADPSRFVSVLEAIEASGVILVNDLGTVRWNLRKTYLREIAANGIDIVPGLWFDNFQGQSINSLFDALGGEQIIIKPVISTNARNTFLIERADVWRKNAEVSATFAAQAFVAQPFIAAIRTEGEYSLFYIGGAFSHAIQKRPKMQDFRVQEEHGASLVAVDPESSLKEIAENLLAMLDPMPVYARCDFVRGNDGRFLVMEIELIEPSLYLRMQEGSANRFASAFDTYARERLIRR